MCLQIVVCSCAKLSNFAQPRPIIVNYFFLYRFTVLNITQFGPGQEYTVFIYNLNEKGLLITWGLLKNNSRLDSLRGCPVQRFLKFSSV